MTKSIDDIAITLAKVAKLVTPDGDSWVVVVSRRDACGDGGEDHVVAANIDAADIPARLRRLADDLVTRGVIPASESPAPQAQAPRQPRERTRRAGTRRPDHDG